MAATGKTPILLYGSTTPTNAPVAGNLTNSSDGCEIAINVADKNLFFKDSTNAVNTVPIRQSSASSNGWLSSTDWSTFNSKQPAGAYLTSVTADAPLTGAGTSASHLSIPAATSSVNGYLTSTDWSTFNGKAPAVTYTTGYIPYGQGTTTPAQSANLTFDGINLSCAGSITSTKAYANTSDLGLVLSANIPGWNLRSSGGGRLSMVTGYIASDTSSLLCATGTSNPSTEAMRVTHSSGAVNFISSDVTLQVGNLVIGTSGKGIDFSATAGTGTSELLADYEEGTWTPTVTSTAGAITSYTSSGTYTKTGRCVVLNFKFTITNNGTGATSIDLTNLPFATAGSNNAFGCCGDQGSTGEMGQCLTIGTDKIRIVKYNFTYLGGTGFIIVGTITYTT